jgi:hypothetical protein
MLSSPSGADPRRPNKARLVPWLCLVVAAAWVVLLRVPLVLNARVHLDSDLAADGLTLLEAIHGHWRWHYPGTPFSGTIPVLLSYAQARAWGATPETLVSGGVVAQVLLLFAVFGLAWRNFGPRVAIGGLVPLTFASTGTIWLSGRITGGHLPVAAWSAAAWLLLGVVFQGGSWSACLLLGAWCGLGLYLDSMFLMTLAGMLVAALAWAIGSARGGSVAKRVARDALIVALGFAAGASPGVLGRRLEPHDAYHEQFAATLLPDVLAAHGAILLRDCLPRLIAGHRLPGLEADPDPRLLGLDAPLRRGGPSRPEFSPLALLATVTSLLLFAASLLALCRVAWRGAEPAGRAIALGVLASSLAVVVGFLINRNIFNADNYRYLVLLLIPWSLGFGLWLNGWLCHRGPGRWLGPLAVAALAVLFTVDAAAWYRQFQWIDDRLVPVRRPIDDPALRWLADHPEVGVILGGYWDVYRLSFLTGGAVRGIPYAVFPDRFPEWSRDLPGGRPQILVARQTPEGRVFLDSALRDGGEVLYRQGGLTIVRWPWRYTR